jgi:flagellar hook-length control protein FliK
MRLSVPPVASQASLLQSLLPAVGLRGSATAGKQPAGSFSLLLESGSPPPPRPLRDNADRPPAAAPRSPAEPPRADAAPPSGADTDTPADPTAGEAAAEPAEGAEAAAGVAAAAELLAEAVPTAETAEGGESSETADAALAEVPDVAVPAAEVPVAVDTEAAAAAAPVLPVDADVPAAAAPSATPSLQPETAAPVAAAPVAQPTTPTAPNNTPLLTADAGDGADGLAAPTPAGPAEGEQQAALTAMTEERPKPQSASAQLQANAAAANDTPNQGQQISDLAHTARTQPEPGQLQGLQTPRDFGQLMAATTQSIAQGNQQPAAPPVPLEGVAVEIAARAQSGRNRFEIRLDPPELGRIEVRLDIDKSGQVTSRLVVEKAETLDVLRRDAHELERALNQAGLKTADNGMQFELRDQSFAGNGNDRSSGAAPAQASAEPEPIAPEPVPSGYSRVLYASGGVDIRI